MTVLRSVVPDLESCCSICISTSNSTQRIFQPLKIPFRCLTGLSARDLTLDGGHFSCANCMEYDIRTTREQRYPCPRKPNLAFTGESTLQTTRPKQNRPGLSAKTLVKGLLKFRLAETLECQKIEAAHTRNFSEVESLPRQN